MGFRHVQVSGAGGGTKETFSKPRALFIRPVHEAHGHGWPSVILVVEAAQDGHASHYIQAAVQPAAVRHRVHVSADEQGFFRLPLQGGPEIARRVHMGLHREFPQEAAEPFARGGPHGSEGHALGAVFVAGEGAQFLEFGESTRGVYRHGHEEAGFRWKWRRFRFYVRR